MGTPCFGWGQRYGRFGSGLGSAAGWQRLKAAACWINVLGAGRYVGGRNFGERNPTRDFLFKIP